MKAKIWIGLKYLLAVFLLWGGIQHFVNPEMYKAFVPDFLPLEMPIIYASGVLEIVFGLMVFVRKYAYWGMLGIFTLMVIFLPIHVMDIFSDAPAIGSKTAAYVRLPIQLLLIWLTCTISQKLKK